MNRKRSHIPTIAAAVMTLSLLWGCLFPAFSSGAEELWSEEFYRVSDSTHELTDYKKKDLDALCIETLKDQKTDLVLLAVLEEDYTDSTIEKASLEYYEDCGFGYGEDRSGFISVYDADHDEEHIYAVGKAKRRIPEDYLRFIEENVPGYRKEHGIYGVMYSASKFIKDYLAENPEGSVKASAEVKDRVSGSDPEVLPLIPEGEESAPVPATAAVPDDQTQGSTDSGSSGTYSRTGKGADLPLPSWYPEDPKTFEFFHTADTTPRVVDRAHIFTDEEQASMEKRLKGIRSEISKDLVIFTDESTYGFDRAVYAADFFDFNGYGCGEDYEGICLMICMDPDDRGWWAACYGPETKRLYTEEYANEIDDVLYEYMAAGKYAEGVDDWITNIYTLYTKGAPFAPAWLPEDTDREFTRFHNDLAPYVTDDANVLTPENLEQLEQEAMEVAEKHQTDVVITTARESSLSGMTPEEYAEAFYRYNGYGYGDDYDGILLTFIHSQYGRNTVLIYTEGSGDMNLTEVNKKRMLGFCNYEMEFNNEDSDYFKGMHDWIKNVDHMYSTGRVQRSTAYWIWIAVFGSVCGLLTGGITFGRARKKMAPPKMKYNADMYMVRDSLKLCGDDTFINKTTSKTYSPQKSDSGSSSTRSSSSRSSYSGSYSSSSGRSHSGSGRSF